VDPESDWMPALPTNTHEVAEWQLRALTAVWDEGRLSGVQLDPAFVLVHDGAIPPLVETPLMTQSDELPQEIALADHEPSGNVIDAQFAPPSIVAIPNAVAELSDTPSEFEPIATHVVAEEHETDRRMLVPPSTNRANQSWPPSTLTRIWAPTATQKFELGQSTDPSAPTVAGSLGTDHV
jgi:hypothetical protein